MKTTLATILLFGLISTAPAATPAEKRLTMEQRLTEADLAVALKHYERVCTELLDARLRQSLFEAESTGAPAERENQFKMILRKIEILERYAKNLREELLKAGRIDITSGH
jgi:hypothetical protein